MSPDTLAHVFEPFFTTKDVGRGTGLGLATVYGTVRQNRGFIDVESEPGRGTTFTLWFPRQAGPPSSPKEPAASVQTRSGHETVLLVEDEPDILKIGQAMLSRLGYQVLAAATPGEAMEIARSRSGSIDLLMTDVVMPEMNGRDLAKNLLAIHPDMQRLFMSGYPANVIARHGVLDPGVHFLQKPFTLQSLGQAVRSALDAVSQ